MQACLTKVHFNLFFYSRLRQKCQIFSRLSGLYSLNNADSAKKDLHGKCYNDRT